FAISQAKALSEEGNEVELVFLRKDASAAVYDDYLRGLNFSIMAEENNSIFVPLYDLITGIFMPSRRGKGRVDYNLIRKFPSFVKGKGYDLIICQDQWAGLAGYYAWKKYGIKYAVVVHERLNDFPWVTGWKRIFAILALRYQKKVMMNASLVLSLTKKVAETVQDLYRNEGLKCLDDFPGLEARAFVPYSMKGNTISLVSFWNEVKNPFAYIPIFRKIRNFKFLMIGSWTSEEYRDKFLKVIIEENLEERVELFENVSEIEKNQIIARSKFFIRFGFGEFGPGYGTIEALENGVPVIINSDLGIADYLRNYGCSLIIEDVSDVDAVELFIKQNDNEMSYEKMQDGIMHFINEYSWKRHVQKLLGGTSFGKNSTSQ
ncbi:MAG: glycosyltransferase family 4 protein, partial [Nitrososphaerota archaeon]